MALDSEAQRYMYGFLPKSFKSTRSEIRLHSRTLSLLLGLSNDMKPAVVIYRKLHILQNLGVRDSNSSSSAYKAAALTYCANSQFHSWILNRLELLP